MSNSSRDSKELNVLSCNSVRYYVDTTDNRVKKVEYMIK